MESRMKEFIESIRENKAFDKISNDGHNFTKDELIQIIKEYDYAIFDGSDCIDIADRLEEHYKD